MKHTITPPTIRPVLTGDKAAFEVEGGWYRKEVTRDGVVVETDTATIFLSEEDIERAKADITKERERRRRKR